jgi:TRAP-type transport system periplasmic protein
MNNLTRRKMVLSSAVAGAGLAVPNVARSQEVTLRTVSAWTEGTAFSRAFERFVSRVNETGKGVVRLNYLGGGAKIMSPFDMGQALRRGVFDMLNTNSAYYSNLIPEMNAIKLARVPIEQLRKNGAHDYLNKLLALKVNAYWLGNAKGYVPFHVYLSAKAPSIQKPDFNGLKLRVTPNYRPLFAALGATLMQTQPSEIYTAMERGVVDGYGWPIQGIDELGLVPVTKVRVDPGFYVAPNEVLINLDVWNKLGAEQKKVLDEAARWTESWLDAYEAEETEKAKKMQQDAGIKVVAFSTGDAEQYLKTAYDAGWKEVIAIAPEHGPRLRELLS